eukprot:gene19354-biopygen6018
MSRGGSRPESSWNRSFGIDIEKTLRRKLRIGSFDPARFWSRTRVHQKMNPVIVKYFWEKKWITKGRITKL